MNNERQASIRDKYREVTSSPEHQRKKLFARTRARLILTVGFPLGVIAFLAIAALGFSPLYAALLCYITAVASGWVIGTKVAAKKLQGLPLA